MKVLFPPRPKGSLHPSQLAVYEQTGDWVVQRKYNGTRTVIYIPASHNPNEIYLLTRHGTAHKAYTPTPTLKKQLATLKFKAGKDYWLDGELLATKTKDENYKGKVVLFDVLQEGKYLYHLDQMQRLALLNEICGVPTEAEPTHGLALRVTPDVWMAETFHNNFPEQFKKFNVYDEIEGLVLRKKKSTLDNAGQKEYECNWVIRCRKPHSGGSYSH
jgi:ATP-dependent DNA ligase